MVPKTGIFTLALSALLLGSTALAEDAQEVQTQQNFAPDSEVQAQEFHGGYDQSYSWDDDDGRRHHRAPIQVHIHTSHCNHGPRPVPPRNEHGRYELKLVQKWIPGRYEQVWVPRECKHKPRRNVTKCWGGYYEQQWVPGRYETVEEWVWVPAPWHRNRGPEWGTPATHWN
jgi:hypothetical protein